MRQVFKRKRGQVFILTTLVVMLFMLSISITFIQTQVTRETIYSPSNKEAQALILNVNNEIIALSHYTLGLYSRNQITLAGAQAFLELKFQDIEYYIKQNGLTGKLTLQSTTLNLNIDTPANNPVHGTIQFTYTFTLQTPSMQYSSTVHVNENFVLRLLIGSPEGDLALFFQVQLSQSTGISQAHVYTDSLTGSVTSNNDGTYLLRNFSTGDHLSFISPSGVNLTITYP